MSRPTVLLLGMDDAEQADLRLALKDVANVVRSKTPAELIADEPDPRFAAEAAEFQHLELTGFASASRERGADLALLSPPTSLLGEKFNLGEDR